VDSNKKYHIFESSTLSGLEHLLQDTNLEESVLLFLVKEVITLPQTIRDEARIIGAANTPVPVYHLIPAFEGEWPEGFGLPCVVVSCVPSYAVQNGGLLNFVIPEEWLRSRTGGFVLRYVYAFGD
jgi:hypothetical protein